MFFLDVTAHAGGGEDDPGSVSTHGIVDITPRPEGWVDETAARDSAGDDISITRPPIAEPPPPEPAPDSTLRPFTPPGTGSVLDNADGGDGKEFFTITTPDENVFYLIIDRQRGMENVYFLNAVTESDLLSLAVIPDRPAPPFGELPPPAPTEPMPEPEPEPKASGNTGMIVFIVIAMLGAGGAGYYFKIYRPKQQGGESGEFDGEDYDDSDFDDLYGDDEDSQPDSQGVDGYDDSEWDSEDTPDEEDK